MADTLDVLSLAEAKTAIINNAGTNNDVLLAAYITGVSRYLDEIVGPVVKRTVTDEEISPDEINGATLRLRYRPVDSITTLTEYRGRAAYVLAAENFPSATTAYDYKLLDAGRTGLVERRSFGYRYDFPATRVIATYVAGRSADTASVDERFKRAAGIILTNVWRNEVGLSPNAEGGFGATYGLPNAARAWIESDMLGTFA